MAAVLWAGWVGPAAAGGNVVRLATTTSTDNSGLLEHLLPAFEAETDYQVRVIAVGTGKALKMGERGDVDVVLVHARKAEEAFVAQGHGVERRDVMYNDFVVVGPRDDPARINPETKVSAAFNNIATSASPFISRGDDSGTHKKELQIWKLLDFKPSGAWYREVGQGMGKVLQIAGELDAYALTDRGTWLFYQDRVPLRLLFEGDPAIFNPYGIMAVNPARYPDTNFKGALALIQWITSPRGQARIADYRIRGEQAFFPWPGAHSAKPEAKGKSG